VDVDLAVDFDGDGDGDMAARTLTLVQNILVPHVFCNHAKCADKM
jgi:hypothetical protein